MGFMDKAKKMAEQAQAKLDEVQKEFNSSSSGAPQSGGPVVEYDKHGRPIPQAEAGGPHGDPLGAAAMSPPPAPPAPPAPPSPPAAAAPPPPPPAPPAPPSGISQPQDRNMIDYTPPKLSSGDPLTGA